MIKSGKQSCWTLLLYPCRCEQTMKSSSRRAGGRPRVALLIEYSNGYARELLRGIIAYARERANWSLLLPENEPGFDPLAPFPKNNVDGVIARIFDPELGRRLQGYDVPVVDVSGGKNSTFGSWVSVNDRRLVALAAEHLLERGLRRLAFCGDPRFPWAQSREAELVSFARDRGIPVDVFRSPAPIASRHGRNRADRDLRAWVDSLPKPVGVLASDDLRGQHLLDACRGMRLSVPAEVAIVGVDNDELVCELCEPRLSSVDPNMRHGGYLAAELMDRLLSGAVTGPVGIEVEPERVESRESTDVLAFEDQLVVRGLRRIQSRACDGITVEQLARELEVSRRTLDSRFHQAIGRTPHDEMSRIRIARVKALLVETTLPLSAIAQQAGFEYPEYLCAAFKKHVGTTPGAYRRSLGFTAGTREAIGSSS